MNPLIAYVRGSIAEFRHVQWPTQQQAVRLSVIVVVFIAVNALVFGLIDGLFTELIRITL